MTDKELRKLSKEDLIEIIYQLKLSEDRLRSELDECRTRLSEAESVTDAVNRLNRSIDKMELLI